PGARLDGGVHLPDQRRAVGFDFALLTPGCRLLPRPGSVRVGMAALRLACARPRWRRRGWDLCSLVLGPPSPSPSPLRTGRLSRGSPGILRRVSGGCPGILRSLRGDVGGRWREHVLSGLLHALVPLPVRDLDDALPVRELVAEDAPEPPELLQGLTRAVVR